MKKLLAIFLALTMVIGLCTACSSSESDTTDEDANSVSESVEDSNDNDENLTDESSDNATSTITKMTVGSTASQFVGHFDASGLYSNDYSRAAADLCYDALFLIDSDGEWYSNVLESCEWDGLTLVLTLKDNIYFSNGDQMMASDVLYSLERYCSSPRMTSNLAYLDLESTTISEDGLTLNLVFTEEYGAYLTMLNFCILNESFVEDEMGGDDNIDWFSADSICGSGPYAVTDVELGLSVTFEKRDDWWQQDEIGDSAATVQTIVCQAYSDNNTMLIDLENGVIDVALNLTSDDVDLLASDGYGTSVAVDSHSVANIAISSTNEILANNETLREAICIGTDAAVIASRAYGSLGSTADSSLSSTQPYYVGGYGYTYDLERAKELVESTGLSSEELTFTLVASSQNACQVIAESFQYYMEQIGITINVEIYDQATCQQLWMESGNTDFLINSFYMPTASNEAANALEWMLGTVYVDFGYAGEISDLLIDAKSTLDTEERAELYAQVQQVVYESYVMVPIAEWSTAYVYGENVAECDISITASPNLRYVTMK